MSARRVIRFRVSMLLVVALLAAGCSKAPKVRTTQGEVEVLHDALTLDARRVATMTRVASGNVVKTAADGRARLRLDDGTRVLMDRSTSVTVTEHGVSLDVGRILVLGGAEARTEVGAGSGVTVASASTLAVDREPTNDRASFYCANGEAVVRAAGKQERIRGGEVATLHGKDLTVAPQIAFNDWTYGMASPGGTTGGRADAGRTAIGEVWAVSRVVEDPGTPLAIRSHEVEARIDGEVATTRVETTYFNGATGSAGGDFRMEIPKGAIVSRFALRRQGGPAEEATVIAARDDDTSAVPRLEWAGSGWVRGYLPALLPGDTETVIVEYVEWLSPATGTLVYRYPMSAEGKPPLIGEFHAKIDATAAQPSALSVVSGATVNGSVVELRRADFRPEADLVVEVEKPRGLAGKTARAYVASAPLGDHSTDPYVLVRTDVPPESAPAGVALALVLDTSWSVGPALLDVERSVVEAVLEGLGDTDRVAIVAADQGARPIGPARAEKPTAASRAAIREGLGALRPGGATDLGLALERAADTLPEEATAAMVVYVGDGWPTVGDTDMDALRKRLSRRARGAPRVAAVAVGTGANRLGLEGLTQGSAPVLRALDRADAASVAVRLLSEALRPAVADVQLDLGPTVDRVYPRTAVAVNAGTTITTVGRLRGPLPPTMTLHYRRAGSPVEERRPLANLVAAAPADVNRRWASARVEELSLAGLGLETAIELSVRSGLLTPWTSWFIGWSSGEFAPGSALPTRVLDLMGEGDQAFAARLAPRAALRGAVLEPLESAPSRSANDDLREATAIAIRRSLVEAMPGVRKCRDLRAALRPEITGALDVEVTVDLNGHATHVSVHSSEVTLDDGPLDRCVEVLVQNLAFPTFPDPDLPDTLTVATRLPLPPPRDPRRTQCSPASKLPLLVRRGIWRARLAQSADALALVRARQWCELPTGADHRAFVQLLLEAVTDGVARVRLATDLDDAGEADSATLVRRAAVRDAATPLELAQIRQAIVGDEPPVGSRFVQRYQAARSDADRLAVVRRFLRLSPHSAILRSRLLSLLEALGRKDELVNEIYGMRQDPFADAGLLADAAAALRRAGLPEDGLRAFGEIVERAPYDPYARAFVGDRLRDEALFDDATAAYDALVALLPSDPAVTMRLALAHAGAGRLDVATRLLDRVRQAEGRDDDTRLGELASITTAVLLDEARGRAGADAARLERRAREVPMPDGKSLVLVRTPGLDEPLDASIVRGNAAIGAGGDESGRDGRGASADGRSPPDWSAPSLGLVAARIERGDEAVALRLSRPRALEPTRPADVRVDLLVLDDDRRVRRVTTQTVKLLADGKEKLVRWNPEALQ